MQCHRLGRLPERGTGSELRRPRPLSVRCLRYIDRDRILKESRKNRSEVANIQLQFAADYSEATSKRRKLCYKVMHEARIKGFQAFLLYPATIKLTKGKDNHLFQDASKAELFISTIED